MKSLKHDTNKRLLTLIIILLVISSIITAYYEYKLRSISNKENKNNQKLNEIAAKLILEKYNKLGKLKEEELALIDKAILEQKYNEMATQNENLKKDKATLKEEITLLKSEIEYHNVRLEGPVAQFRLIQEKNRQINQLKVKIELLCSILKYTNVSEKECN